MSTDPSEVWFERAGAHLFAAVDGAGTPIILLHGGLANHQSVRRFAAPLAAHHRLITPDLRGTGRSVFAGELSWDLLADDIAALVRELGVPRAVIGGISFGAGTAVRVALRHPEVVAGLVVLHPAFGGGELTPAQQAAMTAMNALGRRAVAEGIEVLFPLLETLPPELRERGRAVIATYDPASVAATTRFMASGAQPFANPAELAAIAAPALVVPGVDPTHPVAVAEVYRRNLLHARVVETADFATAIADFVAREIS